MSTLWPIIAGVLATLAALLLIRRQSEIAQRDRPRRRRSAATRPTPIGSCATSSPRAQLPPEHPDLALRSGCFNIATLFVIIVL